MRTNVKFQEGRPNKREKKKTLPSSFLPAVWVSPCSPPVCPSSVPSLCPVLLSNGLNIHLVSVYPVHPILPSSQAILPLCPSVHPYCPSALPFRLVSSASLCTHFTSLNYLSSFLSFRASHLDLPPLKKIFFGRDRESRIGLLCRQAE